MTGILENIVKNGNRIAPHFGPSVILCGDGFFISVIAGEGTYSLPRDVGPFTHVEVGFPSSKPQPWLNDSKLCWAKFMDDSQKKPTECVYAYVPVGMIAALLANHGGAIGVFKSETEMLLAVADRKIVRKR